MKFKRQKICSVLLLGFFLTHLHAENALFVNEKTGTTTSFQLSTVRTLTFLSGHVNVNTLSNGVRSFALNNVRSIYFGNCVSVEGPSAKDAHSLILYPNPVVDELFVQFSASFPEVVTLQILDLQGKLLLEKEFSCLQGINTVVVPVAPLQQGVYLCRIQSLSVKELSEFVKK
jgi:hypothetical protein